MHYSIEQRTKQVEKILKGTKLRILKSELGAGSYWFCLSNEYNDHRTLIVRQGDKITDIKANVMSIRDELHHYHTNMVSVGTQLSAITSHGVIPKLTKEYRRIRCYEFEYNGNLYGIRLNKCDTTDIINTKMVQVKNNAN